MRLPINCLLYMILAFPVVVCAGSPNTFSHSDSYVRQSLRAQYHENIEALESDGDVEQKTIFELNTLLGRGVNLSGLEQATEGDWNFKLNSDAMDIIAEGGFNSVRLPIKWDSRAAARGTSSNGNYPIEKTFFDRVDEVVDDALSSGLRVIINMHLYEDLINHPTDETPRFLNLWSQIAKHYSDKSDSVYFEILNEPAGVLSDQPELWNSLLVQALQFIRASNPNRAVIVGPVGWNLIGNLESLKLPEDERLIVSVHYYNPGYFTHQGAEWVQPMMRTGVDWQPERQRLSAELQNWSWDTDVEFSDDWVDVAFARSGAALNIYTPAKSFPTSMTVRVSGYTELAIICSAGTTFTDTNVRIVHNSTKSASYAADLKSCPKNSTQIAIQNLIEGGGRVKFRGGKLCRENKCDPLFVKEKESIDLAFESASQWGVTNDRPMNLGEFGAYYKADMSSRALWTAAVQQAAQRRGMSSHYWEFDRGFGVWDRQKKRWVEPLYRALRP